MKKLLAIFAFVLIGMTTVQAQQNIPATVPDVPASFSASMMQEIGLNAQQAAAVNKILSVTQPAMETIENSNLNAVDKATKLNAYADREKLNMKKLLTAEQFVQYLELTGRI